MITNDNLKRHLSEIRPLVAQASSWCNTPLSEVL